MRSRLVYGDIAVYRSFCLCSDTAFVGSGCLLKDFDIYVIIHSYTGVLCALVKDLKIRMSEKSRRIKDVCLH